MAKKTPASFKPGQPRHPDAGRKKGTPNKRSQEIVTALDELGFDVLAEKIWVYREAKQGVITANRALLQRERAIDYNEKLQDAHRAAYQEWSEKHQAWKDNGKEGPEPLEPATPDYARVREVDDQRAHFLKVADSAAGDIMQYVYPKRKAVEHTGANGQPLVTSFTDLVKATVQDELKQIGDASSPS